MGLGRFIRKEKEKASYSIFLGIKINVAVF